MFAAAQKKYVYLYDRTGVEVHCLRSHTDVNRLEFLPYHFLLATVVRPRSARSEGQARVRRPHTSARAARADGRRGGQGGAGYLKYQDTSTGQLVAQHRTQMGPCHVMRQNPYNAIIHLGHTNGRAPFPAAEPKHARQPCSHAPLATARLPRALQAR